MFCGRAIRNSVARVRVLNEVVRQSFLRCTPIHARCYSSELKYTRLSREQLHEYPVVYAQRFLDANANGVEPVVAESDLAHRRAEDSSMELVLPFSSDAVLRDSYVTFFNGLRFGKLLGDMDMVAACVSIKHYSGPSPGYMMVTASAESIQLHKKVIPAEGDIAIKGVVTWTGRTSLEVTVSVEQTCGSRRERLVDASFVMVAKSFDGSNCPINPLLIESETQRDLFQLGEKRKQVRKRKLRYSLLKHAPTEEERGVIHDIYIDTLDTGEFSFHNRVKPEGSVWMKDAGLKNVQICHPQDKNTMDVMFGGFLMREAFELAWANTYMHTKAQPNLIKTDDMLFLNPVNIGSLLFFSSQVVFTRGNYLLVRVHAHVCKPRSGTKLMTGVYHFHFTSERPFPDVTPKTYGEFMLYLEGRRYAAAVLE